MDVLYFFLLSGVFFLSAIMVYCTVCMNNNVKKKNISYFCYPKDSIEREKWLKAVGREDLLLKLGDHKKSDQYRICEEHFIKTCIKFSKNRNRKYLCDNAFPTLNLPRNDGACSSSSQCEEVKTHENIPFIPTSEIPSSSNDPPFEKIVILGDQTSRSIQTDLDTCDVYDTLQSRSTQTALHLSADTPTNCKPSLELREAKRDKKHDLDSVTKDDFLKLCEKFMTKEEYVKQKWRNLRDQFQRESKKVKVPFDNPTKPYISYYRGKWYYFEQMLFLKEVPRAKATTTTQSPPQEIDLCEDEIKEEIIEFEDDMSEDQINFNYESDNYERSVTSPPDETQDIAPTVQPKVEKAVEENETEDTLRKRKASETIAACPSKNIKLSLADNSTNTDLETIDDDDLHFVKSLVPFFKKLTPIRKLLVRNEIHNLLIRETLCEKCKINKTLT